MDRLLAPALGDKPLKVRKTMILHIRDWDKELKRPFLVHGHQGTVESNQFSKISRLFVRYVWWPIQRITKISLNTPATDYKLRHAHDSAMYAWSEAQNKVLLITGHTRRPVFKSQSHEAVMRKTLEEAEAKLE